MLVVVSPAKSLNMEPVDIPATAPAFQDDAVRLSKTAKNLTLTQLKGLMGISDDLARLNRDRFQAFAAEPASEATKPAALA
ncbi:MAG: peroxide stress protein YaaA, partial [Pseudomonadota bacterium]